MFQHYVHGFVDQCHIYLQYEFVHMKIYCLWKQKIPEVFNMWTFENILPSDHCTDKSVFTTFKGNSKLVQYSLLLKLAWNEWYFCTIFSTHQITLGVTIGMNLGGFSI